MGERERLIEMLKVPIYPKEGVDPAEVVADYLLDNGVIVPPVKVGQTIYRCDYINRKVIDWSIERIDVYMDEIVYCDDSFNVFTDEELGEGVFLTQEEAERELERRNNENN